MRRRTIKSAVLAALLALTVGASSALAHVDDNGGKTKKPKTVEIQILGLNDFHGALEPPTGSGGRIGGTEAAGNAGGVEYLATHVRNLRATNPNTLFVSAGDLIGATPLLSALFHDEPTIEAFNLMELDYNGVGNHEFDEGVDELLRMQWGDRGKHATDGCHPVDGCRDGDPFGGATFDFLAANVAYKDSGKTIFPGYKIENFNGVKVGIIGMTLEGTPSIVSPAGISHVNFADEAETVNRLIPTLRSKGVYTVIVLLHEGGFTSSASNGAGSPATINLCENLSGPLPPIVQAMSDEVDVVITGHTNWAVNCVIDGKIVTGAASAGRLITDIDLTIDRRTDEILAAAVNNRIVTRDVAKAPDLTTLVAKYQTLSAPFANRVIGKITAPITRTANAAGESALGDVIADAQQFDAQAAGTGSQVAFMNAGGIRADLTFPSSTAGEGDGNVTYGEAFTVQPFGNSLVTMTLNGAQIDALLERQFTGGIGILQVSNGFAYAYSASAPADAKVSSITLNGLPISPGTNYRVTVNSFLADGGDNYGVLRDGTDRVPGNVDTDAFENYLKANPAGIAPGPQNRITRNP